MNVEIGTAAGQFPEKEYINGIFVAVCRIRFQYVPTLLVSFALCTVINCTAFFCVCRCVMCRYN